MTIIDFFSFYSRNLINKIGEINFDAIVDVVNALDSTVSNKSKIYIVGNGGSAATASHMCNDLGVGLKMRGIRNFNVESLGDNVSVCTAIANDTGY